MSSPWLRHLSYLSGRPPSGPFSVELCYHGLALVLVAAIVAVAVAGNRFTGLVATVSATL